VLYLLFLEPSLRWIELCAHETSLERFLTKT